MAADSAYGQDHELRAALEHRRIPYVMAVPVDEALSTPGTGRLRVGALAGQVPAGLRAPLLRHQPPPPSSSPNPSGGAPTRPAPAEAITPLATEETAIAPARAELTVSWFFVARCRLILGHAVFTRRDHRLHCL